MATRIDIVTEIAAIGDLSREDLCQRWQKIYGHPPPKGVRRELMIKAVAWNLQAKRLGGYSAEQRRLLRAAVDAAGEKLWASAALKHSQGAAPNSSTEAGIGIPTADSAAAKPMMKHPTSPNPVATASSNGSNLAIAPPRRQVHPGARLRRDWNGRTHVVDVIEGGFVFEAKIYASLSAIARKITNAHWSGPRFFGL